MSKKTRTEDMLTVEEASSILGVSGARVRQAIKEGQLAAHKHGKKIWAVTHDDLIDYLTAKGGKKYGRVVVEKSNVDIKEVKS